MKKSALLLFVFTLFFGTFAQAQTIEVSGEYYGHVLWDADTVRLMGDVVIEPEEGGKARLTIERGTCVIAEGYYRITVHNGSFYALGADKYPITFTARDITDFENADVVSGWRGIHVISDQNNSQDSVVMEYCKLSYGKVLNSASGEEQKGAGLYVTNKKYCYFAHCDFDHNHAYKGDEYLDPHNGGGAMYVIEPGTFLVEYCVFHDNFACWGASISVGGLRHLTVKDCEFYNNTGIYGTAVDMHLGEVSWNASGPQVYNNYIHGNHGNTAYLGWDVSVGRFHDNIIVNNEGFSPVIGSTAPNYSHYYNNTIANNDSEGFLHGNGSGIWTCGQQKIYNNIFYGNTGIFFERMDPNHDDPTAFNNCHAFPNGVIGDDDVYANPQFLQPTEGLGTIYDHSTAPSHWTLLETSPCRDAGATNMSQYYPETDFFGNPRVVYGHIDMEAIEFPDLDAVEELTSQSCVYPNPGRDMLHILTDCENAFVVIYDLNGRKIFEQQIEGNATDIATETWPAGVYAWKVYNNNKEAEFGKWIKQ